MQHSLCSRVGHCQETFSFKSAILNMSSWASVAKELSLHYYQRHLRLQHSLRSRTGHCQETFSFKSYPVIANAVGRVAICLFYFIFPISKLFALLDNKSFQVTFSLNSAFSLEKVIDPGSGANGSGPRSGGWGMVNPNSISERSIRFARQSVIPGDFFI